jgi:hypothetical protein
MVTMVDEIFQRDYDASRAALNGAIVGGLSRLGHSLRSSLEVLHRMQFAAPWTGQPSEPPRP